MTRLGVYCLCLLRGRIDLARKLHTRLAKIKRTPDAQLIAEARRYTEKLP